MSANEPGVSPFPKWRAVLDRSVPALDGIRGLAILAVLFHQLIIDRATSSSELARFMVPVQAGWVGVELFFVLSGFLITGILLDTRAADNRWSSFFMRRCLRIFPPYYFVLAVLFWVVPRVFVLPHSLLMQFQHQSWYWLYIANWAVIWGNTISPLAPYWSLSVEEQFYLVWPLLVFTIEQRNLIRGCILAACTALTLRIGLVFAHVNPEIVYEGTFTRMDALTVGALTAIVVRRHDFLARILPQLPRFVAVTSVAVLAVALVSGGFARTNRVTLTLGHSVLIPWFACWILVALRDSVQGFGRVGAFLSWAPLRLFGKHSYVIYLIHLPLHVAASRLLLTKLVLPFDTTTYLCFQLAYYMFAGAFLLGISMVFYQIIERPMLDLKRHFVVRRRARPTADMEAAH